MQLPNLDGDSNWKGWSPLSTAAIIEAVQKNDVTRVSELLEQEPSLIQTRTTGGLSLIMVASYYGASEVQELLRNRVLSLDLHEAAVLGDVTRINAILTEHPDLINGYSCDGLTALGLTAFFGQSAAARALLENGADVRQRSRPTNNFIPENTALHSAVAGGKFDVVKVLVEYEAEVNNYDSEGMTPLHHAAFNGDTQSIAYLAKHGASLKASTRTANPQDALAIAEEKGRSDAAELLRRLDATA